MSQYVVYGAFFALAVVQLLLASGDGRLSRVQVRRRSSLPSFPATMHGAAMVGDTAFLPLVMFKAWAYRSQWTAERIYLALAVGALVSILYHISKPRRIQVGGHLYEPPNMISRAGLVHSFYMSLAIAGLILYYGWTSQISHEDLLGSGLALVLFFPVAIWQPDGHYYRNGRARLSAKLGTVLGIASVCLLTYLHW